MSRKKTWLHANILEWAMKPSEAHTSLHMMLLLFGARWLCSQGTRMAGSWDNSCLTTKPVESCRGTWFSPGHTVRSLKNFEEGPGDTILSSVSLTEMQIITAVSESTFLGHFESASPIFHSQKTMIRMAVVLYYELKWPRLHRSKGLLVSYSKFLFVLEVGVTTGMHILYKH